MVAHPALLALGVVVAAAPASAYVQPSRGGAVAPRRVARSPPRSFSGGGGAPRAAAPDEEDTSMTLSVAALSCGIGAALGWANARRRQAGASAAAAAAAGLSPLAAGASTDAAGSSVTLAMDPLNNPDLGYVFLVALTSMSIALVVWGRNGL
mmetsp:Transcript_75479/g.233507  ORF Transcript_75479/g.233507 Transcript_75479/m.233507 type:complete len:152 (+) Transcript_75479:141-596(+)